MFSFFCKEKNEDPGAPVPNAEKGEKHDFLLAANVELCYNNSEFDLRGVRDEICRI